MENGRKYEKIRETMQLLVSIASYRTRPAFAHVALGPDTSAPVRVSRLRCAHSTFPYAVPTHPEANMHVREQVIERPLLAATCPACVMRVCKRGQIFLNPRKPTWGENVFASPPGQRGVESEVLRTTRLIRIVSGGACDTHFSSGDLE